MSDQTPTFYTQESLNFITGDDVTAGVIFDGIVHTFHGEISSSVGDIIPYDPKLVATKTKRTFFTDDGQLPEGWIDFVSYEDVPEDGELRQINSYFVNIDSDTVLPFGPENVPEEYREGCIASIEDGEGREVKKIVSLCIPRGLIMGRRLSDDDPTPTFPTHIGRRLKARKHYYDLNQTPPKKGFFEFTGPVVGFQFSKWGLPQYILQIQREEKSDEHTDYISYLQRDLHESLHLAYPGSKFVLIDNDYKVTFAPEKIGTYRQEYMAALTRAIDERLFRDTVKSVTHKNLPGEPPFWFAKTVKDNYISSATKTLGLHMETDSGQFLALDKIDAKYTSKIKAGDVIFGITIGDEEKKKAAWFFSRDYPGFSVFYEFIKDADRQKELQKTAVNEAKHNNSHTPFSMLLSGYFDHKVDYAIVKKFKSKYLWYL